MSRPRVGLSLMREAAFCAAAAPLFAAGLVEAVEWSFDTGWDAQLPPWLLGLLAHYSAAGRLYGHGVHYSPLSAAWEERQARWLDALSMELDTRSYVHVSEHYGFMTAPPFTRGAPLPPLRVPATLKLGRDRLRRLRARLSCPLGLENLALAWNRDEALAHGAVLGELLEAPEDFLLLDLHNLYCQAENFDLPAAALLMTFPLERVRELHISGGSWRPAWPARERKLVRCDTHDEHVPTEVFELLRVALEVCPNVRVVILERLGSTVTSGVQVEQFRRDFHQMRAIVEQSAALRRLPATPRSAAASAPEAPCAEAEQGALEQFQSALLQLLSRDLDEDEVRHCMTQDPALLVFRAHTDGFDSNALGIAARVVKKWARREKGGGANRVSG